MNKGLTVFLVRHGESEWNLEGRLQGQTSNIPLTALGREQANHTAAQLANSGAQIVVSSDLLRTVETACTALALLRGENLDDMTRAILKNADFIKLISTQLVAHQAKEFE